MTVGLCALMIISFSQCVLPLQVLYAMFFENECYRHYKSALKQKEIPVYNLYEYCTYGFKIPKDIYYLIRFECTDELCLYKNDELVLSTFFEKLNAHIFKHSVENDTKDRR